jgi:lipopolysaccharide export system permease protein
MRILERYIFRVVMRATLVSLFSLVALLIFFNFIDQLDDVGKGLFDTGDAFIVATFTAPRFLYELFPVSALIGALLGLGSLSNFAEINAMRASGFSVKNIIVSLSKLGVFLFFLTSMIGPVAEKFAQDYKFERKESTVSLRSQYGFWAKDGLGFVNIRNVSSDKHIADVYLYEFSKDKELTLVSKAKRADLKNDHWVLSDVNQTQFNGFATKVRNLDKADWNANFDAELLTAAVISPSMLPVWQLGQFIDYLHANGLNASEYQVAYWLKLATPFAAFVMLFLAVPFVIGSQRDGSKGKRVFIGAMLGSFFFFLTRAMSHVAVAYDVSPGFTTMIPSLIFLGSALWLLKRVR